MWNSSGRSRPGRHPPSVVSLSVVLDVPAFVGALRVVMREVDQSTLGVPDILAVDGHVVAFGDRDPRSDGNIVLHLDGDLTGRYLDNEPFVCAGRARLIAQQSHHGRIRRHLDVGTVV